MNGSFFLAAEAAASSRDGFITSLMWLVPLLPFVSTIAIGFFGKKTKSGGSTIGIFAVGTAFVISLLGFIDLASGAHAVEKAWTWFQLGDPGGHGAESGGLVLQFGMNYDFLTGIMFVVVTGISLMVHIYSTGYMHDDSRYTWFFTALSLFTGSMLLLVIANNLMQALVGWEGVGVCSYFLIGHYWEEKENSSAAIKAFITTRIGDVGFLFGIFGLFIIGGTFNIPELNHLAEDGAIGGTTLMIAALLLFLGPVGKSAQFPLHVWLPDAMAGPTPVSALIHAATMVVAGIYLVARMLPVYEAAGAALDVVAIVAAITMLIAAGLAVIQDDIKRVLAYSTISQLGYMMAALGVGAYTAGIFHLFTHAVFKALLFLGAGSLIHAVHSNNMSDMGGLRKYMPHTYKTFMIGSLALAGIFPFAGFFSKDEILASSLHHAVDGSPAGWIVFVVGMLTAFLTALYVTRMVIKTFFGDFRGHGEPHESPGSMVTPLWILAIGSATVGLLGIPVIGVFQDWITLPGEEHHAFSFGYNIILPAVTMVLAGFAGWLGYLMFYKDRIKVDILGSPFAWAYRFLENKYYLDDIYMGGVIRPVQYPIARFTYWTNQHILDGVVNGVAAGTIAVADQTYDKLDQKGIDYLVNGAAGLTGVSGGLLKYIQSGNIQRYAAVLFAAVAIFVALLALT
ncbi:MAG: NADH-quinone oxidoreductase subunit L [Actinobacteria bacterium]|nr:NADH-quinone oxidoreductase subunit L [Actinomycetota bacterium]